jgi:hypothetical protein
MGRLGTCALKRLSRAARHLAKTCAAAGLALFGQNLLNRIAITDDVVARIENSFSGMDETAIFLGYR